MLALLAAFALVPANLQVSYAKVEITPPEPLPLGGYTERLSRKFEPGGDPLFARCVLLRQGDTKVAVVSAEMLTIPESLHREVNARIPADVHLFLAATHTHCAPDSQMLNDRMTFSVPGIAKFDPKWLEWYAEKIASVVGLAAKAETASAGEIFSVPFRFAGSRPRRAGGQPDQVGVLVGLPGALIAHYAAHPVFYGPDEARLRGDWPGSAMAGVEGLVVLQGAIGDVSPLAAGGSPGEKVESFVGLGVEEALKALSESDEEDPLVRVDRVSFTSMRITLAEVTPHPEFAKRYNIPQPLAESIVGRFAPPEASITAFRIGKVAFVGIPGEPTSHLGRRIRDEGRRIGFKHVLVCSLVNGWMGYILDPEDYDRGGYEATLSFHGREQGEWVVEAAIEALRALARVGASK